MDFYYTNMLMRCTADYNDNINYNFQLKIFDNFLIFANEYLQNMFLSKNKKTMFTSVNPNLTI